MYSNNPSNSEIYQAILSDDDIDVLNPAEGGEEEDEMMREEDGTYRHPDDTYMDEEVYEGDDQMHYQYMDEEAYDEGNPEMDTDGYIDDHYINAEQAYLDNKEIEEATLSAQNVEHRTTEERLQKYPEMRHMAPLRKIQKKQPYEKRLENTISRIKKKLDPTASAINNILVMNGINPSTGKDPVTKHDFGSLKTAEVFLRQNRLATGDAINCDPIQPPRIYRPRFQNPFPEPRVPGGDTPAAIMTPLPDRYFQRRHTVSASVAGFHSECLECQYCGFLVKSKVALDTHVQKHDQTHRQEVIHHRNGLICPIPTCEVRSDCIATVLVHLSNIHHIDNIMFERVLFKDMTEFKVWRSELERLTQSKFSRTSGKKNIYSKSTYYQCHHSGNMKSTPVDPSIVQRKRQTKKLGRVCTAFFHVKENPDGTVLLRGCTKHTGHGKDVRSLPITDDIKMEIAHLLIQGLDENEIVDKMRRESDADSRRFYLQNYEVRNVYSKIEKYKEDYKRRMMSGEALPDLADLVTAKAEESRQLFPAVHKRAKLSRNRFPATHEPYERYYPEEAIVYEEEVVEDDGIYNVPKEGEVDQMRGGMGTNVEVEEDVD